MTGQRYSLWGVSRPINVFSLTMALLVFMLGVVLDMPWQIGWCFLFVVLSFELFQSLHDLGERYYVFDAPLFSLGMLVFTVFDPVFAVLTGTDFPGVDETFHSGNAVGNMAGLVVSLFCLFFFIGRLLVRSPRVQRQVVTDPSAVLKVTTLPILALATSISLFAFLMNGGGFGLDNLINTITARTRGYVAFSTSGLGTEDPMIALFGQCVPTAVILWIISVNKQRLRWSAFAVVMSIFLLILYVLLGGRSGVIFVLLTIAMYLTVRRNSQVKVMRFALLGLLAILMLSFQSNFRDRGEITEGFFEYSPFRGFALNREIAFIVETYGENESFIRGPGVLPRVLLPIPETLAVFAVNPIPRKFWDDKPVDPSFGPFNSLRTGSTGFGASSNITPTIPGRYYINYGLIGVSQIGVVFGILWRLFDRMATNLPFITSNRVLVAAMLNAIMFISLRDFTFGKFYPLLFLLLFMLIGRLRFKSWGYNG